MTPWKEPAGNANPEGINQYTGKSEPELQVVIALHGEKLKEATDASTERFMTIRQTPILRLQKPSKTYPTCTSTSAPHGTRRHAFYVSRHS